MNPNATERRSLSCPLDVWIAFDIAAEEKGIAPMKFVRRLLEIIAEQDLIAAVWDGGDKSDAEVAERGERPRV